MSPLVPPGPATQRPTTVVVRRRRLARGVFVALVVGQLLAVYWPRVEVQGPVPWTDKVVHVLLFLLPTLAGLLAGLRPAWLVGLLALHAPVSELVQHVLLPGRTGDVWDAVVDLVGVALAVLALLVVGRRREHW